MNAYETIRSFDQNGVLGELTGKTLADVERLLREELRLAQSKLEEAAARSRERAQAIRVDASRLSGVNGGDFWEVRPDGIVRRGLELFPDMEEQLLTSPTEAAVPSAGTSLDQARPLLCRAAYNGLWSPSGTNWQPIRSIELTPNEATRFTGRKEEGYGLLVLTRLRYESMLGDVAKLCGVEQASQAEHIDLGIWLLVAEQTARAHGWWFDSTLLPRPNREASDICRCLLQERLTGLQGVHRSATEELLRSVGCGDHLPAAVLLPRPGRPLTFDEASPGGLRRSRFDELIEARSTQRVASPALDLEHSVLLDLWARALQQLPSISRQGLSFPVFTWKEDMPRCIGQVMLEGIEGRDGKGGLVAKTELRQLRLYLSGCAPGCVPEEIRRWTQQEDAALEKAGAELPFPVSLLPPNIRGKFQESGLYHAEGERFLDHRGHPLTVTRLMRLVRLMATSFGRFFLSFQNTHPLLGVILAATTGSEEDRSTRYLSSGRAVAAMTLLARARGLISVIKSGPIEIAREGLTQLLSEKVPEQALRERVSQGMTAPLLVYQVGGPLGPQEIICAGQPDEHTGLAERLLDRRAPRAPLSAHYVPVPPPPA